MSVRIPKYRLHKASGQALVQIAGHRTYLGKYGSPESREKYRRLVAEWLATGPAPPATLPAHYSVGGNTVNQLILAYWHFAERYYRKNGKPTGETENIRVALRPLRQLYGSTPASDFGPDALETLQRSMIESRLSRGVINSRISRIKRMFRWASRKRLVPGETYYGLKAIEGLQRGRYDVRETSPVKPVPDEHVAGVLEHVNPVTPRTACDKRQWHRRRPSGSDRPVAPLRTADRRLTALPRPAEIVSSSQDGRRWSFLAPLPLSV